MPSAVDSFFEGHILESAHYQIFLSGEYAGFTSIHKGSLVTQYSLLPTFRHYGQDIFAKIKKLEEVQAAFVPTCDEFFLSHALDEYQQLNRHAYFFATPSANEHKPTDYKLTLAKEQDVALIKDGSGDFFGDIPKHIQSQELFLVQLNGACVGFGFLEKSNLLDKTASLGMFVIERFRKKGAGTAIVTLLINACHQQGLQPIAGCWYYNHLSKKTLERAGMYSQTRLLRVTF